MYTDAMNTLAKKYKHVQFAESLLRRIALNIWQATDCIISRRETDDPCTGLCDMLNFIQSSMVGHAVNDLCYT